MSFQDIMSFMLYDLSSYDFELWIVLLWFIWRGLCRFKHDKVAFRSDDIFYSACDFVERSRLAKETMNTLLPHYRRLEVVVGLILLGASTDLM